MSEGKDSIDLSALAAAVPNAAGLFASLSIPVPAARGAWYLIGYGGFGAELSAEDKANLVASIKVRFLFRFHFWFVVFFWPGFGGSVVGLGIRLMNLCCACSEHAAGIDVAACGRAREPRAQGQEARWEAQGDPGIRWFHFCVLIPLYLSTVLMIVACFCVILYH
jgi:hypothetical protein